MADWQEEKNSQVVEKSEHDSTLARDIAAMPDIVGIIDQQMTEMVGLPMAGPVRLTEEDIEHIQARHSEQIKKAGFDNVRDFVTDVLSHIDAVYEGNNDAYAFIAQGTKHNDRVLTILEATDDGKGNGLYTIKTAHPINSKFYKNKTPLWDRAQTSHFHKGTPRALSGQSGENDVSFPGNAPNNRLHEGTPLGVNSGGNENIRLNLTAPLKDVKDSFEALQKQKQLHEQVSDALKNMEGEHQDFLKALQERIPGMEEACRQNADQSNHLARDIEKRDKTAGLEPCL